MDNLKKSQDNFYITSPIYYVNDAPHIGHAYTSLACDVLSRFKRLQGYNVHFLTGTDEHGQKVEKSAISKDKTPLEFCNEVSNKFLDLAKFLDISNDDFIRTTQDRHKKTVQEFWKKLENNSYIYKDVYEGWYALRDEAFYSEDEIIDGKAPSGAEVTWHKEESYFFKLSAFENNLLALFDSVPDFIQPASKRNEVISFVKSGLKDLSISRTSFKWGIPVPNDERHVIYVWLDALVNYLSALQYPDSIEYKNFWENTVESPIHIVGKDILRFHAVYWPAFLMAAQIPLPNRIFAHGWWTNEGQKISKSVGNIIDPYKEIDWIESLGAPHDTAIDYFRYFLLKEIPFGNDGDYSQESLVNRINAELANNIGNLAQRSLSMIYKNCQGKIPQGEIKENTSKILYEEISKDMDNLAFDKALGKIINYSSQINKYFNDQAPWNLNKEGKIQEMNNILYQTAENIRIIALFLLPFLPKSSNKILDLLKIPQDQRNFSGLDFSLKSGTEIDQPKAMFSRLCPA